MRAHPVPGRLSLSVHVGVLGSLPQLCIYVMWGTFVNNEVWVKMTWVEALEFFFFFKASQMILVHSQE